MNIRPTKVLRRKRLAPDRTEIVTNDATVLESRRQIMAVKHDHAGRNGPEVSLGKGWDDSRGNMNFISQWLGHGIGETRKRLGNGRYEYRPTLTQDLHVVLTP